MALPTESQPAVRAPLVIKSPQKEDTLSSNQRIGELFTHLYGLLFADVGRMTIPNVEPDDVIMDVFVMLLEKPEILDVMEVPKDYIAKMSRNRAYRLANSQRRQLRHEQPLPEGYQLFTPNDIDPQEAYLYKEKLEETVSFLRSLPLNQRTVLVGRIQGFSHDEIAHILQVRSGNSRLLNFRATQALEKFKTQED